MSESLSLNPLIKKIRKSYSHPNEYPDICVVEGIRASSTFVKSPYYELEQWFVIDSLNFKLPSFLDPVYITYVSQKQMNLISRAKTPSGIVGLFYRKKKHISCNIDSTFVLYNITDPGNLGTIIRTAVALNRKSIILIGGCHHHSYKVVQSSAGTVAKINVIKIDWETFLNHRNQKIPLYALDIGGQSIEEFPRLCINECYWIIGNEAHGIPQEVINQADTSISIPMSNECESLNAAIAAAIVGYRSWTKIYE